jgi:hypothetical protein
MLCFWQGRIHDYSGLELGLIGESCTKIRFICLIAYAAPGHHEIIFSYMRLNPEFRT